MSLDLSSLSLSPDEVTELGVVAEALRPSLIDFVTSAISGDEFEARFLRAFQSTGNTRNRLVGGALDEMFFAVDDYVGHGMVVNRDEGDIDVGELLTRARQFVDLVGWDVAG